MKLNTVKNCIQFNFTNGKIIFYEFSDISRNLQMWLVASPKCYDISLCMFHCVTAIITYSLYSSESLSLRGGKLAH